jgi:hypothetical protein
MFALEHEDVGDGVREQFLDIPAPGFAKLEPLERLEELLSPISQVCQTLSSGSAAHRPKRACSATNFAIRVVVADASTRAGVASA